VKAFRSRRTPTHKTACFYRRKARRMPQNLPKLVEGFRPKYGANLEHPVCAGFEPRRRPAR